MSHISECAEPLKVKELVIRGLEELLEESKKVSEVCLICLPFFSSCDEDRNSLSKIGEAIIEVEENFSSEVTLVIVGEVEDLIQIQAQRKLSLSLRYQHWIAIKRSLLSKDRSQLPNQHFGAIVYTKYKGCLKHTKTRVRYSYCPACDRTSKDYGGKKHTYHMDGTLLSDVWRDIECNPSDSIRPIIERFADLMSVELYTELIVLDCRQISLPRSVRVPKKYLLEENKLHESLSNQVLQGDCLDRLQQVPDNSIDFAFADPPYNLKKKYSGYEDNLEVEQYFQWCDSWLKEIFRTLKPGRTCAILNLPLWAVRHSFFLETVAQFQSWIVWDALAFPVRLIMPAHYTILCFSKGESRGLPGLTGKAGITSTTNTAKSFDTLNPLAHDYCLRLSCIEKRGKLGVNDRAPLTDLWTDIHRLKHNSRRVDHPCQLPPHLMYRLISVFTQMGEIVLDCFNGAGTTTLAAHQLGRRYVGIEASEQYCQIARERHCEVSLGLDPFRKENRILVAKNSPVPRLMKQKYQVSKKQLQLEVRRVASEIGHLPSREEVIQHGLFSIEYYDKYFSSWGEVCAAARTTGMTEVRTPQKSSPLYTPQIQLELKLESLD